MRVLDRSITAWQAGILIFVLLFANKILVLPSLLYEGVKVEGLFILLLLFAFEMGLLVLFYFLKRKFSDLSFGQILQKNCSNFVRIVFYVLFCVYFLSKAVLLYNVTYIFFRNVIYKDYNNFLFLFCFLPIINHMALSGLRAMGRTVQLFFPVILLITLFCVVVGFLGCDSMPLFFQSSLSQVVQTGLKHISAFGDMIFLFVIFDKVKVKKGDFKVIFSLSALAMVLVMLVAGVFFFSYTDTAFMHPYAIFDIVSYVKEYGGLGRIDIISMVVIIIFSYFQLAIYLKAFMLAFDELLPKIGSLYGAIAFNFCFLVIVLFFILNLEEAVVFGEQILPYMEIFPYILIPISVIISLLRGKKERKKRKILKSEETYLLWEHSEALKDFSHVKFLNKFEDVSTDAQEKDEKKKSFAKESGSFEEKGV